MVKEFEKFMISQAGLLIRGDKFLILRYSSNNKWGLPGGRIDKGETGKEALKRELKEEIGFDNFKYLGIADYDFYYYKNDNNETIAKCDLVNLIENDSNEIKITSEHNKVRWIKEDEVGEYEFAWPNMERLIKNGFKLKKLLQNGK